MMHDARRRCMMAKTMYANDDADDDAYDDADDDDGDDSNDDDDYYNGHE